MDHLSSCYFCSTALDETLRDYRVVPVELRETDETTTATLCQSCHDKLERLLAPVVEAAGEKGATLDAHAPAGRAQSNDEATHDATGPEESTKPDGSDDTDTDTDADTAAGNAGGSDDTLLTDVDANLVDIDEESVTGTDDAGTPDTLTGGENEEDAGDNDTSPGGETDSSEPGGDDGDTAAEDTDNGDGETVRVTHRTDDGGTGEGTDTDEPATGEEASTGGDTDGGDDADTGGNSDEGGQQDPTRTTISALEYNKVMRLLQNREFPIDRGEFVTVAANAYGLAEHECAEVIDLAIDRGLVAERDGDLVRPDS